MTATRARKEPVLKILLDADRRLREIPARDSFRLYESLHSIASRITPTDAFYISLYSVEDETLLFPYNYDGAYYSEPARELGGGPTSWVIRNGAPFVLTDETRLVHRSGTRFGNARRISAAAVHLPMRAYRNGEEVVVGVMSSQRYDAAPYEEEEIEALQWLADQAGRILQQHWDEVRLRHCVDVAEATAEELRGQKRAIAVEFSRIVRDLSCEVEALRAKVPPELRAQVEQVCRLCHRCWTEVSEMSMHGGQDFTAMPVTGSTRRLPELTDREAEILRLLSQGKANEEIARILYISVNTVRFHINNLYRKLDVTNRVQALRAAWHLLETPTKTPVGASGYTMNK